MKTDKEALRVLILKYGNAMHTAGTNLFEPRWISDKYDQLAQDALDNLMKAFDDEA